MHDTSFVLFIRVIVTVVLAMLLNQRLNLEILLRLFLS